MKIQRIRLVYFSATGTTQKILRRIGETLAQELGASVQEDDFTLPAAREHAVVCVPDELALVGTPVYAGRVPNVLLPYLKEKLTGNGAPAVPIVLFGNRNYDDALIELRDLLEASGFRTIAGAAFVGAHSFSYALAAGLFLGTLAEACRSPLPGMVMHLLNNACSLLISLYGMPALAAVLSVLGVAAVVCGILLYKKRRELRADIAAVWAKDAGTARMAAQLIVSPMVVPVLFLVWLTVRGVMGS